jgi:hypothetical protein
MKAWADSSFLQIIFTEQSFYSMIKFFDPIRTDSLRKQEFIAVTNSESTGFLLSQE